MINLNRKKLQNLDHWLIAAVCILSVFGIICIGSALHVNLGEDASSYYSQMMFFGTGLIIMIAIAFADLDYFSKMDKVLYLINILLLVAVILVGSSSNNAVRWIKIGPIRIQPSEFSKVFMIFCMANFIDKKKDSINNIDVILRLCISAAIPVFLVFVQPALSASIVIMVIFCVQLFVSELDYRFIVKALVIVVPIVAIVIIDSMRTDPLFVDLFLKNYMITRIRDMVVQDPGSDTYYQTLKSISAISSGQLAGKGLYEGTLNQLSYLPEPQNDFIFSVIGEEFGFVGCVGVLALMFFVVARCITTAMEARNMNERLIASGVAGMLAFQTFVNVGVATGILPNTGMSLPFVSSGGSSLWTNMAAIGLVLNIKLRHSRTLFEGEY
ncbi:MAG: FtsW/RodA/SpoVE family cell cycle protein [Candidatus Metalachnospira sp.]|nr:FtsW/RodA/SpoVE family cell cycle protein [Candidatus Metalachnospira sp.]